MSDLQSKPAIVQCIHDGKEFVPITSFRGAELVRTYYGDSAPPSATADEVEAVALAKDFRKRLGEINAVCTLHASRKMMIGEWVWDNQVALLAALDAIRARGK